MAGTRSIAASCRPILSERERSVVAQLAELAIEVRDGISDGEVVSLGVAVPGLYIPETGVVTFLTNVPGDWSATPCGEPVSRAVGLPTALINDARAFGLAELRFGAGRDVDSFIGFTLGTGVGGVFAIGNQVIQGYRGQAGELGHQTIDPDGPWCGCGNRGCVEAYCRADQVAIVCGTRRSSRGHREGPRWRPACHRRPRRDRPLPGHRHQQRHHRDHT